MGFSDLGCYGSEIRTPNLDRLARQGLRFSQMHNSARCCPSRAALLTGLNPQQTGVGHAEELAKLYDEWAERCGVVPWPVSPHTWDPPILGEHNHVV